MTAQPQDPRGSQAIPVLSAIVPLVLAALRDPESRGFDAGARELLVGLSLGLDRSHSAPLGHWLAPLSLLVPVGPLELRASIMMAIPASFAAYLVARRVAGPESIARARGAWAIALAFALTAAVLLGASSEQAAVAVIAVELGLMEGEGFALSAARGAALALSLWCAPRLFPMAFAAVALQKPSVRRVAFGAAPVAAIGVATMLARSDAWLSLGHAFSAPSFAAAASIVPPGALLRPALACALLGVMARVLLRAPTREERLAPVVAGLALACAIVLRARDGVLIAGVVLAPLAVTFAGALSIAVEKNVSARTGRLALVLLVPALSLGLGARAFEVDLGSTRIGDAAVAHDLAPLVTLGVAPPRAVLVVEDEEALLRFAHARVLAGVRPDLHVLPAQALAAGGAARMANATIAEVPTAADPLRALLARGTLEPADVSPLALKAAMLAELPFARLKGVSRLLEPTGGAAIVHLERIDPSDRKLRRPTLERRLGLLARLLSGRPADDRLRRALRVDATREARALSLALDREGALAAVARAAAFGADADRTARWTNKLAARQSLELEPISPDD